jgi:hypothetical protein
MLNSVPGDIMITVIEFMSLHDLASIALTCRTLYELVNAFDVLLTRLHLTAAR